MDNIPAIVWLILLLAFAALEGITVGLTSIWFAAGALAALIAALLHGPLWLQIALFLVVSILCLLAVLILLTFFPILVTIVPDLIYG